MVRPRSLKTLAARRAPECETGARSSDGGALATCQILVTIPDFWVAVVDAIGHRVAAAPQERSKAQGRVGRVDRSYRR